MIKLRSQIVAGTVVVVLAFAGCSAKASGSSQTQDQVQIQGKPAQAGPAQGGAAQGAPGARSRGGPIQVQGALVHIGPLVVENGTAGTVLPATQSSVATQVAGVVATVIHKAGDWVKEGDPVIQLDDSQLKLSLQIAQANLENAKINLATGQDTTTQANPKLALQVQSAQSALSSAQKSFDASQAMFKLGGISASALDSAQSQLQQAQANLAAAKTALDQNQKADTQTLAQLKIAVDQATNQLLQAQLNLRNSAIRAPFSGQISAVNVTPGEYVSQNLAAFIIVSRDLEVDFSVAPADALSLKVGTVLRFTYAGKSYPVRVKQAPSAPINGIVPMVASFTGNLTYGAVGTISYSMTLANGALVPIAALQTNENQDFVYAIRDGKAVNQPITILAESGTAAAVSGLEEGTTVILSPPPGLLPGSAVQAVTTQNGQAKAPGAAGGKPGSASPQAADGSANGGAKAQAGGKPGSAPAAQEGKQ